LTLPPGQKQKNNASLQAASLQRRKKGEEEVLVCKTHLVCPVGAFSQLI